MILSNPISNYQYQNKNVGSNPYAERMAGLLQYVTAQKAKEEALAAQAAQSQQGGLLNGFSGLKDMLKKSQAPEAQPLKWENAAPPPGYVPPPQEMEPMPQSYGMESIGRMEPAKPSQSFKEMLPNLVSASQIAYPDNPTMQKVALTQAILESGLTGRPSDLATKHNNYFGIKASKSFPGSGGTVDYGTTEYVGGQPVSMSQGFASNNSMADSFKQHANLMYGSSRYQPVIQAGSPEDAFAALGKSGYATDPNYANKLRSIYGRYVAPAFVS